MPISASEVVTDIRTLADVDAATSTLSDAQILSSINWSHEHYYYVILDADEGFFETVITSSLQAGTATISSGPTTTFIKIDLVECIGTDGTRREVVPLRSKKEKFQISPSGTVTQNDPLYYYLQGNLVLIHPPTSNAATDALEITIVPAPTRISTTTTNLDLPDAWAKAVALMAIGVLDLRLRDGRTAREALAPIESELIQSIEGRQRQEPRRINIQQDSDDYDGCYLG